MAEIREEVIVDVKVESADTQTRVDELTRRIQELKADTDKLSESNKKLAQFGKENTQVYRDNSQGIEINKRLIQEAAQERRHLIDVMLTEDKSIKALQLRNKELIKERNQISTATEEGRAKIALLNKEIDANNEIIQANVSELEQQKINIGNYASALDGVIPGMSGYVRGTEQMITASRTFIATPIGAVIGALGLALGALIAYFKGSEEGQDRWNKVVQVSSALLAKFMDFVRDIGEAIANTFSVETLQRFVNFIKNDLIGIVITNLTNRFKALGVIMEGLFNLDFKQVSNGVLQMATGVEDVIGKTGNLIDTIKEGAEDVINSIIDTANEAVKQGSRVAELERAIRLREREDMIQNAQIAIEVAKLRQKASYEEGEERRKTLEQAIELEEEIHDREVELARMRLALAQQQSDISDSDIAANDALAKAKADVYQAELRRYTASLRLHRQLASAMEEEQRAEEAREKERQKAAERELKASNDLALARKQTAIDIAQTIEERVNAELELENLRREQLLANEKLLEDEKALIIEQSEQRMRAIRQKGLEDEKKQNEAALKAQHAYTQARIGLMGSISNAIRELAGRNKALAIAAVVIEKAAAIANIVSNTAIANAKAVAQSPLTFGMPWVAVNTASGIAAGISVVAETASAISQINGYARGGLTGTRIGPHHGIPIKRSNGDNLLATVKTGEVILNERQQAALGGARTFRAIGVPGFAGGGLAGMAATSTADSRARIAAQDLRIEQALREVKPVLVLQDFEAASEAKNAPIQRAQVI